MTSPENTEIRLPQARHAIGFYLLLLAVLTFAAFSIVGIIAVQKLRIHTDTQSFRTFLIISQALLTVGLLSEFMRRGRFDWRATLSLRSCRPSVYLWAVVSVVPLSIILGQLASYLIQTMPWLMSNALLNEVRMSRFTEPGVYLLYASAISLGPGLTEELAFRGFILRGLDARFGSIRAITLTALLFALLHVEPLQILIIFPVGLYLGYLVVRSGSLYPAILAHTVNNLWATLEASLWQANNPQTDPVRVLLSTDYPPIFIVAALVLLAVGLYASHRITKKEASLKTDPQTA